jgi:hypothetical protein
MELTFYRMSIALKINFNLTNVIKEYQNILEKLLKSF